MKRNSFKFLTVLAMALALVGCKEKAENAETTAAEEVKTAEVASVKYMVDAEASSIDWKGFKPTESHNGTLKIEKGVFSIKEGAVESGTFMVDMNSITVLDIPADKDGNANLVGHLKNTDFFDVAQFPNAAFEVTGFETKEGKSMLSGNLSIKNIKHNITFPVTVAAEGDMMSLTSEAFTIDRTKWDIKYKSKSIFGDLGDKFILDDIELKIAVKAKKS